MARFRAACGFGMGLRIPGVGHEGASVVPPIGCNRLQRRKVAKIANFSPIPFSDYRLPEPVFGRQVRPNLD